MWSIDCIISPSLGRSINKKSQAPWSVLLRFLFVDMHRQLKDHSDTSVYNWRNYQTKPLVDQKVPTCNKKLGRRVVFSQEGYDHSYRMFKGDWMVVAYVWGESREWLDSVDVRELVSWENAIR